MKLLDFGVGKVEVTFDQAPPPAVADFVDAATHHSSGGHADLSLRLTSATSPGLVFDDGAREAILALPWLDDREPSVTQIAVLQAAARCLALVTEQDSMLLHGSTTAVRGRDQAVAVLDGGRGQGKTSLAFGLARAGGELMSDEFAFARRDPDRGVLVTFATSRLPWHVRADMAPYLVPDRAEERLLFPVDMRPDIRCAPGQRELIAVLVPDAGQVAGTAVRVEDPLLIERMLRQAVTDHRAKLLDPRLDHVSLFSSPAQVTSAQGVPLLQGRSICETELTCALSAFANLPLLCVGIGTPADIAASVEAALDELRSIS